MAALLLGFNGSVFNFANLFVNLFMRDCVNCSCAVACVCVHCGSALTMAPRYLKWVVCSSSVVRYVMGTLSLGVFVRTAVFDGLIFWPVRSSHCSIFSIMCWRLLVVVVRMDMSSA